MNIIEIIYSILGLITIGIADIVLIVLIKEVFKEIRGSDKE